MSPLAKSHPSKPGLTERFELYINKFELINAYGELSDPVEQSQRFANQLKDLQVGDEEAMNSDETFCEALEYGMPPIAGWGLGIDRLTLLLTDSLNIKEVILFPAMRPQQHYEPPAKEDQISEKSVESQDDTAALVEGQDDTAALVEVSQILGELLMWDDNCKK